MPDAKWLDILNNDLAIIALSLAFWSLLLVNHFFGPFTPAWIPPATWFGALFFTFFTIIKVLNAYLGITIARRNK